MYKRIASGYLEGPRAHGKLYNMALLDESYLSAAMDLQQRIVEEINDPVFYDPVLLVNMQKRFRREGRIIGSFINDRLVALLVLHFPPQDGDNFGNDVGLSQPELRQVAHLASMLVHPDYRGNALAFLMNKQALPLVQGLNFSHVCSTVFPANFPNIATMFKTGLVIKALKDKYEGKPRYIFYQDLARPLAVNIKAGIQEEVVVPCDDYQQQQELLTKGYYGYQLKRVHPVPTLSFTRSD